MKVTIIQMNSTCNKAENLKTAEKLINAAVKDDKPNLVCLPEMFSYLGGCCDDRIQNAEDFSDINNAPALKKLSELAVKHQVFIHGGSICEKVGDDFYNTTPVFDSTGKLITTYRKIHLFSAHIENQISYREGDFYSSGSKVVTYPYDNYQMGCSICYDLRFPELYHSLRQADAEVIMVPSAFIETTGKEHWEVLCRARAVETQSFVVAPNQTGDYTVNDAKRYTWGHSMIIGPWGRILASLEDDEGFASARLDLERLAKIRRQLPIDQARRL